ncbi:Conserved_hypothetical protein [Hexamita inflata]|uniref:Uncharacterized protein n=1 Tax=Hexamita inflata TaxID=28002 RepID=A0ABP1HZA3_9EUKA
MNCTNISDIWSLQFLKNLKNLNMNDTRVIDLHPLQHLFKLEQIELNHAYVQDVSPLSKLTALYKLEIRQNYISNWNPIRHHKRYYNYSTENQDTPSEKQRKLYNKILSVHNSQKYIEKLQNVKAFRISLLQKRQYVSAVLYNHMQVMNQEVNMFLQFIKTDYFD